MQPRPRETNLTLKRHRILNEVFRQTRCHRSELAKRLNINTAMVGTYVEDFLRQGLLIEDEPVSGRRGRNPVPLLLNPAYGRFLGLDFEALRARVVVTDFAGAVVLKQEEEFPLDITRERVLERIVALARSAAAEGQGPLLSVGVASPGQVDVEAGEILHYALLPDFSGVPIRRRFAAAFDAPVFIEDNIRALTFAEMIRGAGRDCDHFLCLAVRSGVGLGMVLNGELYRGVNAMAGEVGYTVFPTPSGPRTMTDLVSAVGIAHAAREFGVELPQAEAHDPLPDIVEAAEQGDTQCRAILDQLGLHLGLMAANLANIYAPEKIVLVGEVPCCCLSVRQAMECTFRKHTLPQIVKTAVLENGALSGYAGALGAAYLGFAKTFPVDEASCLRQARARAQAASGQ